MELEIKRYEGLETNIYWTMAGCECWYNNQQMRWGISLNTVDPVEVEKKIAEISSNIKTIIKAINISFNRWFVYSSWEQDYEYYDPKSKSHKLVVIYRLL